MSCDASRIQRGRIWQVKFLKNKAKESLRKKMETSKSREKKSRHKRRKVQKNQLGIKKETFSQGKRSFQMGWKIQEWKHLWGLKLAKILKEGAFMVRVRASKWMNCSHRSPIPTKQVIYDIFNDNLSSFTEFGWWLICVNVKHNFYWVLCLRH